jgi:hypothetical protein
VWLLDGVEYRAVVKGRKAVKRRRGESMVVGCCEVMCGCGASCIVLGDWVAG